MLMANGYWVACYKLNVCLFDLNKRTVVLLHLPRRLCVCFCLFVCMLVRLSVSRVYSKSCEGIFVLYTLSCCLCRPERRSVVQYGGQDHELRISQSIKLACQTVSDLIGRFETLKTQTATWKENLF